MCSLSRSNKSFPFLRTDSVSDNESDRGAGTSRDRASPSPIPGDYDFKRYSNDHYGDHMANVGKEMKKPNQMHFEKSLRIFESRKLSTTPSPYILCYWALFITLCPLKSPFYDHYRFCENVTTCVLACTRQASLSS
ncbi:unnamed protein product [Ceratitis capitata]|uniref:(Mediterranean fruit fly) hypothetical protein n=1 Tax=Ceratitis capitata TaxID=7213 RepID=A0A811UAN2_CERCA|nr:unnamed protein product [Ceratitis capitata]